MPVIFKARNYMPVQMRNDIAERGEVDLVGMQHVAHGLFGFAHHLHQTAALGGCQVGHFLDVLIKDDAAKAGVIGRVGSVDHAAKVVFPEDFFASSFAQWAGHSKTRSMPPLLALLM